MGQKHKQRGAALVVGLILLVILTLLAVSGMNTATMDLIMAGNEQFRQNAARAAETGLEQAAATLGSVDQSATPTVRTGTLPNAAETYTTSSLYMGDDENVPGFSANRVVGLHYEITSTGQSARNARSGQSMGTVLIQKNDAGSFGSIN